MSKEKNSKEHKRHEKRERQMGAYKAGSKKMKPCGYKKKGMRDAS